MTYKPKFATLVPFLIVVVGTVLLPSHVYGQTCNAATIQGSYGGRFHAFFAETSSPVLLTGISIPGAFVVRTVFTPNSPTSSDGTITTFRRGNIGGTPQPGSTSGLTGSYHVDSDCTGTFTVETPSGPAVFEIVIVDGGAEIEFAQFSAPFPGVGDGVMKKQ